MLYYEDLPEGYGRQCGQRRVSRDEIVEFARKYDPQPFHVDEGAAMETEYDDIIASGLHVMAMSNRLAVDGLYRDVAITTGPGIEHAYHRKPVRPGDRISVEVVVDSRRPLESREREGLVKFEQRVTNQADEPVSSMVGLVFVERSAVATT